MIGTVAVAVARELLDTWDAGIPDEVRRVAQVGADEAGGRLLADDPEFVIPAQGNEPVMVHYRMVK